MCGITGVAWADGPPVPEQRARDMAATLRHRGPDHLGSAVEPGIALGHTRLSVIDLSAAANQPMESRDGRYLMVYNGEVYNFMELRSRLEALGHVFRTRSDTEVVLAAYVQWGLAAFPSLNGMFALAIWDRVERSVTLARDRFGIKPLYYHLRAGRITFGSEIKAILASGEVDVEIDHHGLHEYLVYGNPHAPRTLYAGIRQLEPGTSLTFRDGTKVVNPYWSVTDAKSIDDPAPDAAARVRELLDDAVQSQLVSDVPLGVFLSGGIDSSAVTMLAARHSTGPLRTFSVGFDYDKGVDELPYARTVAKLAGTDHHELHLSGGDLPAVISSLLHAHDQPFADAANIPLYRLAEEISGEVTVVLQGDGGDEMFAGYRRYALLQRARLLSVGARAAGLLPGTIRRRLFGARIDRMIDAFGQADPAMRMALLLTLERLSAPPLRILDAGLRPRVAEFDPFLAYREAHRTFSEPDPVQEMLHTDASILLPNTFLEKVDRATMQHSIEVRVPYLDMRLSEYALGLPASYKVRKGQKKWLLRQALRGLVPDEILDRPKTGFGVPYGYWLRTSLSGFMRDVLLDGATAQTGLFDRATVARIVAEHTSGERDHGFLLYKALNLAMWHHDYVAR